MLLFSIQADTPAELHTLITLVLIDPTGIVGAKVDALTQAVTALGVKIDGITDKENQIMATQQENQQQLVTALNQIGAATDTAAAGLQALQAQGTTIKSEVEALQAAMQSAGVPQALVDQANSIATKTQALSDGVGQFVPFLQGVASEGAMNPVPTPPPPAPTTSAPTP